MASAMHKLSDGAKTVTFAGPSSSTEPRKCECQPCCGRALSSQDEPKHEQVILACGHIGCNFYQAGKCIVCESDKTSRRWSGLLQRMSDSWNGSGGFDMDDDSSDDEE